MDNDLLINGLSINWADIDNESYLRNIESIKTLNNLYFNKKYTKK